VDFDAALGLALRFEAPTAVVIKHTNPAGVASAAAAADAYRQAVACDPRSAYGCVLGFNTTVDAEAVVAMKGHFIEGIIAPDFTQDALEALKTRKSLRLLRTGGAPLQPDLQAISVRGGLLLQTRGYPIIAEGDLKVVSRRHPTAEEARGLLFGARILGHVRSNAIVLCRGEKTVGIGAGQMSRVDAVALAALKAGTDAKGSVMASDAFFPFRDGIDEAAKAGVTAVLQPGGSIRDSEVLAAADEQGMAMVFTGIRMFKH
jgi:phosphoribosylaminoimidazolecarboxamide formyltransferase/IMP cyclohydrolase